MAIVTMLERESKSMTEQMQTIDLGSHAVDIAADQSVTIANEAIVVELDCEEAYRLLVVLQDIFK